LQVTSVEVEVPAEILRLGFEFADTPGIGSAIEVNTATTERFLPQAALAPRHRPPPLGGTVHARQDRPATRRNIR
jgi:hypothetical protein